MGDRRAGFGGLDRGLGDLLGADRDRRVLANRISGAGHGTGDDHLAVHSGTSLLYRGPARPEPRIRRVTSHATGIGAENLL